MDESPKSSIETSNWTGFSIKTIKANKGLINIITKEDKIVTLSVKELLERMNAIAEMPELQMLKEERDSIHRFMRLGMKAIVKAKQQLGQTNMPESVKLYLAGGK